MAQTTTLTRGTDESQMGLLRIGGDGKHLVDTKRYNTKSRAWIHIPSGEFPIPVDARLPAAIWNISLIRIG